MPTSISRYRNTARVAIGGVLSFAVSILLVFTATFIIFEAVPGKFYDVDNIKSEQVIHNIIEKYQLDASPLTRYIAALNGLPSFNFGYSYVDEGQSVRSIIFNHAPVSLVIGVITILLTIVMSLVLSSYLSLHNRVSIIFNVLGVTVLSVPVFVLAVLFQFFIGVKGSLLPVYGIDDRAGYILPIITLSIVPTIILTQLLTRDMRKTRQSLYVLAARARGVSADAIMIYYVFKNSLTASLTYAAPIVANILAGSFIVESIFNIPGLGRYFIDSITNRDYPVIAGVTIFYSIILIALNSIANAVVKINDKRSHSQRTGNQL